MDRYVLLCTGCGFKGPEFNADDARFLKTDKEKYGIKTPCNNCKTEMDIFKKTD